MASPEEPKKESEVSTPKPIEEGFEPVGSQKSERDHSRRRRSRGGEATPEFAEDTVSETVREHREKLKELTRQYRAELLRQKHAAPESAPAEPPREPAPRVEDDKPIVMLNTILSRQAGLKVKHLTGPTPAHAAHAKRVDRKERGRRTRGTISRLGFLGAGIAAMIGLSKLEDTKEADLKPVQRAAAQSIEQKTAVEHKAPSRAEKPEAVVVPHKAVEVSIDKKGEGAIKLYEKLVVQLANEYPDREKAPALVQKLLAYPSSAAFAQEMGFLELPMSAVMRMEDKQYAADTFRVSADGKTLVYIDSAKKAHVVVETKSDGKLETHKQTVAMRNYSAGAQFTIAPRAEAPSVPDTGAASVLDTKPSDVESVAAVGDVNVPTETTAGITAPSTTNTGEHADIQTLDQWNAEHKAKQEAEDVFTNEHGVTIDTRVPAIYQWQIPGDEHLVGKFAYGGSSTEASDLALQYVSKQPNATVMFERILPSPNGTVTRRVDAWTSDRRRKPKLVAGVPYADGRPVEPPNPRTQFIPIQR